MKAQKDVELEFAYTTWEMSCRNLYGMSRAGTPIVCRRPIGHGDDHAAGFGYAYVTWKGCGSH